VVQLLTEGVSLRETAARLFVSTATVKSHRANAMRKVGARSRTELARHLLPGD
jgi:DNA-binding NarL/FixJ family response regulator